MAAAFPCLESQFWASETYAAAGDPARAAHHADIFFRLYKGAMAAGDGSSMDRAITVLSVGEEYLILSAVRRLDVEGQHLEEAGGHSYDCMDVRDPETGAATQVYFNIDSLLAVLHRKEMT